MPLTTKGPVHPKTFSSNPTMAKEKALRVHADSTIPVILPTWAGGTLFTRELWMQLFMRLKQMPNSRRKKHKRTKDQSSVKVAGRASTITLDRPAPAPQMGASFFDSILLLDESERKWNVVTN